MASLHNGKCAKFVMYERFEYSPTETNMCTNPSLAFLKLEVPGQGGDSFLFGLQIVSRKGNSQRVIITCTLIVYLIKVAFT